MRQVWRVARYRFRATFARRWSGYLAIVLMLGLIGGLAMSAVAGARRTQSSFRAFLESTNPSDITVVVGRYGPQPLDDPQLVRSIGSLPHVTRMERVVTPNAFKLGANGKGTDLPADLSLVAGADGLLFDQDRVIPIEGRMPDPRRAGEMVMTADAARVLHARGRRDSMGLLGAPAAGTAAVQRRAVGIAVLSG